MGIQMNDWGLLPICLVTGGHFLTNKDVTLFPEKRCRAELSEFTKTREIKIRSQEKLQRQISVFRDPLRAIKIDNVDKEGDPNPDGVEKLKEVKPFSTVLSMNSGGCDRDKCKTFSTLNYEWTHLRRITIGYNRNPNKLLQIKENGEEYPTFVWDKDYPDDPKDPMDDIMNYLPHILIGVAIVLVFIIAISVYCICKKEKKPEKQRSYQRRTYLQSSQNRPPAPSSTNMHNKNDLPPSYTHTPYDY